MGLIENLMAVVPDGRVIDIRIGLHWTAAVVEVDGKRQCGMASTVTEEHQHGREPDIQDAGHLLDFTARELVQYALSERMPKSSVGMAILNARDKRKAANHSDRFPLAIANDDIFGIDIHQFLIGRIG